MKSQLVLSLRADVPPMELPDGSLAFRASEGGPLVLRKPSPGMADVFARLRAEGATESALAALAITKDGPAGIMLFQQYAQRLVDYGLLCHTLTLDGEPLATITPVARHYRFRPDLARPEAQYVLSHFAYSHNMQNQMVLESPLGYARIILHDSRAAGLLAKLAQPQSCADLTDLVPEDVATMFVTFLLNAEALTTVDKEGNTGEEINPTLGQWDFHDMLFHMRSRLGRHNNPYGGTYRSRDKFDPLPLVKPHMPGEVIPLYKPDLEQLKAHDVPFTAVMEQRKSIREYGEKPLTVDQLGEFLYRTARFKFVIPVPPGEQEVGLRPYPGGGAIHELEIYPIVDQCEGLAAGVYHYNALEHSLSRLDAPPEMMNILLNLAWITADR